MKIKLTKFVVFVVLNLFALQASAQCPGSPLTLSLTSTVATCPANGSILSIGGGGVAPYEYRITSGPITTSYQAAAIFQALLPGNYTVEIKDICNSTLSESVTVVNGYTPMTISRIFSNPICNNPGDGSITNSVTGGTAPLSYRLLLGGIEVAPPQASAVFTNLPAGNYTSEVTDSCGEIRTINSDLIYVDLKFSNDIKVSDNNFIGYGGGIASSPEPFSQSMPEQISGSGPIMINCDSVAMRFHFDYIQYGNSATSRRVWVKDLALNTVVYDETFNVAAPLYASPTIYLKIGENYRIYNSDLCDDIDSTDRNYATQTSYVINGIAGKQCDGNYMSIVWNSDYNTLNRYSASVDTLTIIASSFASDSLVGKQIIHKKVRASGEINNLDYIYGVTVGATYTIEVKSMCGSYNISQTISAPLPVDVGYYFLPFACKKNLAFVNNYFIALPIDSGKIYMRINSGPASFTDVAGNIFPINYPIEDSAAKEQNQIHGNNLSEGIYDVDFWDQCGDTLHKTLTITNNDVLKIENSITADILCNGGSSITVNTLSQQQAGGTIFLYIKDTINNDYTLVSNSPYYQLSGFPSTYTFTSLLNGVYRVVILPPSNVAIKAVNDCDTLFTEDVNLFYELPQILPSSGGFVCIPGTNAGGVIIHAAQGLPPYSYQQLSIPDNNVIVTQVDSLFTGLIAGTYRFRIVDVCGNAVVTDISIDTLLPPAFGLINNNGCVGTIVQLYSPALFEDMTYSWSGPNGFISSLDTITFNPFTLADTGSYTITQTYGQCPTTYTSTFTIDEVCLVLPVNLNSFVGAMQNIGNQLIWSVSQEQNFSHYELQRSTGNDKTFTKLATLNGTNARINTEYTYTDKHPSESEFYRLKMVDIDGNYSYSNIVYLHRTEIASVKTSIFPNPISSTLNILYTGNAEGETIELDVIDIVGRVVMHHTAGVVKGINTITLDSKPIIKGNYILRIKSDESEMIEYIKFIK